MKQFLFTLIVLLLSVAGFSQFTMRLTVNNVATKNQDDIYVAGTFNNWNPHDEKYKLKPFGVSRRGIVLKDMAAGKYEFKFTRGSMDKVETTAKGQDIPNHEILLKEDLVQEFNIPGWKDDYPDKPKPFTATPQVKVLDTAFTMPQLKRTRRIWAYLPKSYTTGNKKYPVIYMQDGQNLFNEQTAQSGEWGIDETLDTLIGKTGKEAIIIGIDNGREKRASEYNPYGTGNQKGEGSEYADFLALTLKPYIDKNFRTFKDSAHTFVAGSDLGAVASLYAVVKYPAVFGGAGLFSPTFDAAPALFDEVAKTDFGRGIKRFYFYAGSHENRNMLPDMDKMIATVEKKGNYETRRLMNPLGKHDEATWRKEFTLFYLFVIR